MKTTLEKFNPYRSTRNFHTRFKHFDTLNDPSFVYIWGVYIHIFVYIETIFGLGELKI
jgi:hypothetical protein